MSKMTKRILSLILCFVMLVGVVPVGALATDVDAVDPTAATEQEIVVTEEIPSGSETEVPGEHDCDDGEDEEDDAVPAESEVVTVAPETTAATEVVETTEAAEVTEATEASDEDVDLDKDSNFDLVTDYEEVLFTVEENQTRALPSVYDAALIFTDLHTNSSDYKTDTIASILGGLNVDALSVSSVTSGGDAFSVNSDSTKYTGKTATITKAIQDVVGEVPVNYVWSDHDRYAVQEDGSTLLDKTSRLIYGAGSDGEYGTEDDDNYYIYSLSMGDLCSYDRYKAGFNTDSRVSSGFTATVAEAIANFKADTAELNKDRPLLIVSHQPLFDRRNDNAFAEDWFDAINEVALTMDVAFFYGHNHKYDVAGDYYYARGSEMPVATSEGWQGYETGAGYQGYLPTGDLASETKELNFTHLCAGYMAPSSTGSTSSTTREGTVMTVLITDDEITYTTYGASGVYTGNYAVNETITRKVKGSMGGGTTPESSEYNTITDEDTGVTVKARGMQTLGVGAVEEVEESVKALFLGDVVAYDITPNDTYIAGSTAYVTMPIPDGMDAAKFGVYHLLSDGTAELTTGQAAADGKSYTFITNGFSVFVGGEIDASGDVGSNTDTGTGALAGGTIYTLAENGVTAGEKYLIANGGSGNVQLLTNNDGSAGSTNATVTDKQITLEDDANVAWTFSGDTSSGTYKNGSTYINLGWNSVLGNSQNLKTASQGSGAYQISYTDRWTLYLTGTWQMSWETAKVYLFEETNSSEGDSVTFKLPKSVELTPDDKSWPLTYEVTLGSGAVVKTAEIEWTTSNSSVVTVENGVLSAQGTADTAIITAELKSVNGTALKNSITLNVNVTVKNKEISSVTVAPMYVEVERGTSETQTIGTVTVNYKDNTSKSFPLTLDMLDKIPDLSTNGTYNTSYTYSDGHTVTGITVEVINKQGNNQPEYPEPGSVKVNKTADATYLQQSGLVNVELSTSGLPYAKGVDVIVMLDLSSSMTRCIPHDTKNCSTCGGANRLTALQSSLELFEEELNKSPNKDNIKVAIADFNVFYTSGPVAYDSSDYIEGSFGASGTNKIYTSSTNSINAEAFIPASSLNVSDYTFSTGQGTNYDYAFDTIYQLGSAIRAYNKQNDQEDRELVVLFMSDGAANQFNFYRSTGGTSAEDPTYGWNYWLDGTMTAAQMQTMLNSTTHSYYFDDNDHDNDGHYNEHRMANAIKGDPSTKYEVIRKSAQVAGGVTLEAAEEDNMYWAPGLGAKLYAVAFDIANDGPITDEAIFASLQQVPTSDEYYVNATSEDELKGAFNKFASDIVNAAENAYFVDQLGDSFNLQIGNTVMARQEDGTLKETDIATLTNNGITAPVIEVRNYSIYKAEDVDKTINGVTVTAEMIGKRYGDAVVVERITFNAAGTEAYSSLDSIGPNGETIPAGQNILLGNVIYAKNFYYNNNATKVTLSNGIEIEPETFRWNIGTINNLEWAISYYAYLAGSMEGNTSSGSYKTNNYAILYYKNWLGNDWFLETTSPQAGWESANVSYAFYLVDQNGNPVVNQTTGQTGNFINAVKVTSPVVFDEIMLNNLDDIDTIEAKSLNVLPAGYDLYDPNASYKVVVLSEDGKGSWTINSSKEPQSTYVTGYSGTDATNVAKVTSDQSVSGTDYELHTNYDYTHTTVWFAVVWVPKTLPDTVVIDYGLPVNISVLANDQFGTNGKLNGIGTTDDKPATITDENLYTDVHSDAFTDTVTATYGNAKVNGNKVTYTPHTMNWSTGDKKYDKFAYEVEYDVKKYDANGNETSDPEGHQYYYGDVTVIPATTVYYEDDFIASDGKSNYINFQTYNTDTKEFGTWGTEGTTIAGATQAEDRPGSFSLKEFDANNVYGRDQAYDTMAKFSMGTARKVHVDATNVAIATFEFYGSGLDIISMTSNRTGTLIMQIQDETGKDVYNEAVDTYYGYKYVNGTWQPAESNTEESNTEESNTEVGLYQIPVLKADLKNYGKYSVTLHASYFEALDHTTPGGYDLYLDGVRIYDPAGTASDEINEKKETIQDVYKQDHEGWPSYQELRNLIITAGEFYNADEDDAIASKPGVIFIDGSENETDVADYTSYGPNNELYLANGQAVAFELDLSDHILPKEIKDKDGNTITVNQNIVDDVQLGVKSADGKQTKVRLTADNVSATREFKTSTEMYYSFSQMVDLGANYATNEDGTLKEDKDGNPYFEDANDSKSIVILENIGEGVVSITNIKLTFKENPNPTESAYTNWSREIGEEALTMLRTVREEEKIPEETVPEETVPEETIPEKSEEEKEAERLEQKLQKALEKAAKEAEKIAKKLQKAAKKLLK